MGFLSKYNPFKMWGSYAGMIIGILPGSILQYSVIRVNQDIINSGLTGMVNPTLGVPVIIVGAFVGFVLGWIIHIIIKKLW